MGKGQAGLKVYGRRHVPTSAPQNLCRQTSNWNIGKNKAFVGFKGGGGVLTVKENQEKKKAGGLGFRAGREGEKGGASPDPCRAEAPVKV